MNVIKTHLPGVLIIEPDIFGDKRGFFMETWNRVRYGDKGLAVNFVQDNLSFSQKGVLRGLHFQYPNPQGKLVYVLQGEVFDVSVDIRLGSPTFGRWQGVTLSGENKRQFYIPEGFAHGFCVTSDTALFAYKCTEVYTPKAEHGLIWNDPDLGIDWPVAEPLLSEKDTVYPRLRDLGSRVLPRYAKSGSE
ncbi:dTDP-4-dehydrorhamnose 3,5-epimerase [Peptococcaceae bacterium CEB3]|nr:dTDP-4-dehydrorhamnose 3,5-epimerase [Peptococcaceae bacterium CEB3]